MGAASPVHDVFVSGRLCLWVCMCSSTCCIKMRLRSTCFLGVNSRRGRDPIKQQSHSLDCPQHYAIAASESIPTGLVDIKSELLSYHH